MKQQWKVKDEGLQKKKKMCVTGSFKRDVLTDSKRVFDLNTIFVGGRKKK